jgi:methylenetetrahydrofolate reductase (NADPH)
VITQLFFDNRDYFEFRNYLTKLGVTVPLVPGIIPILSAAQIKKFTARCGAGLPQPLITEIDKRGDNEEAVIEFGIEYAGRGRISTTLPPIGKKTGVSVKTRPCGAPQKDFK